MPTIRRPGKTPTAFDFDTALKARLEAFVAERGSSLTRELHNAIERHLDNPPPREGKVPHPRARTRKRAAKES